MENNREVSIDKAKAFQKANEIKYFTEASAKSGDNVLNLFKDATRFLYSRFGADEDLLDGAGSSNSFAAGSSNNGSVISQNNRGKKAEERRLSAHFEQQPPLIQEKFKLVDNTNIEKPKA